MGAAQTADVAISSAGSSRFVWPQKNVATRRSAGAENTEQPQQDTEWAQQVANIEK